MDQITESALAPLHSLLAKTDQDHELRRFIEGKDEVLTRYRPIFQPGRIHELDEETFRSFLQFENNRHWTGLHRRAGLITQDMKALREALGILLDDEQPLADRFDKALERAFGLGKAIASAILLVAYPERYGVWNNTSEGAMKQLGLWPDIPRGATIGERYELINRRLRELAQYLGIDLWTLDALWWRVDANTETAPEDKPNEILSPATSTFLLERHLQEFLVQNWNRTPLGHEWEIHEEQGEAVGIEFPTDIGRIDLLARRREGQGWLVVELKRNQTSDQTLGQLLRYMGWVRKNLADDEEPVQGVIIAAGTDPRLRYALTAVDQTRIRVLCYRVEFFLEDCPD